jgi:hypothetical protein
MNARASTRIRGLTASDGTDPPAEVMRARAAGLM